MLRLDEREPPWSACWPRWQHCKQRESQWQCAECPWLPGSSPFVANHKSIQMSEMDNVIVARSPYKCWISKTIWSICNHSSFTVRHPKTKHPPVTNMASSHPRHRRKPTPLTRCGSCKHLWESGRNRPTSHRTWTINETCCCLFQARSFKVAWTSSSQKRDPKIINIHKFTNKKTSTYEWIKGRHIQSCAQMGGAPNRASPASWIARSLGSNRKVFPSASVFSFITRETKATEATFSLTRLTLFHSFRWSWKTWSQSLAMQW